MNTTKLEVLRFNNQDVVSTSLITCENAIYHMKIYAVNQNFLGLSGQDFGKLYKNGTDSSNCLPSLEDVESNNYLFGNSDGGFILVREQNSIAVDFVTPAENDWYYWDGSSWKKCPSNHNN